MSNLIVLNKIPATSHWVDIVAPASCANGYIVKLGTQNSTTKCYAAAAPAAVTDKGMAVVLSVPLSYEAQYTEDDYTIATGDILRAYKMQVGDVVSIPQANITATAALTVGYVVVPVAGAQKMACLTAVAGTEVLVFIIDELYTKAGVSMAKIRCILAQ
jgi:hypothetical protein